MKNVIAIESIFIIEPDDIDIDIGSLLDLHIAMPDILAVGCIDIAIESAEVIIDISMAGWMAGL